MNIDFKKYYKKLIDHKPITSFVDIDKMKYDIQETPGIYSFWFDNNDKQIIKLRKNFILKGPDGSNENIEWDWNLDHDYICLYIGKTTNLKKRISQHLLLKTDNLYPDENDYLYKKTTSCQLRAGFDFLYQWQKDVNIFKEMKRRIHISSIEISDFKERFYVEDYLIGHYLPWFNVDSER